MKTLKYLAIAASALLLAVSCQETLEKSEVEAGFAPKGAVPTATISMSDYSIDKSKAEVKATFSGLAGQDSLEIGFLVSADPTFTSSTSYILDATSDGTYSQTIKVATGKKNYVKAMAATTDGASFSETLVLDVPQVYWYHTIADQYTTDLYSYWDEGDCSYKGYVLDISFDLENLKMTISNIDAWAKLQGVPTSLTGDVDLSERTVTFTADNGMFDAGLGAAGFYTVALDPEQFDSAIALLKNLVFKFSEDGQTLTAPLYATLQASSGQFGDIYLPCVYTAK